MSTLGLAVADSATMLRRNLKHMVRYPVLTGLVIGMPVILLLLFVYVFGGTLGAGLAGAPGAPAGGTRSDYLDYVTPGIVVLAIAAAAQGTAIGVAMDMTEGIIARFRSMSISRAAVMVGHVLGSTLQTVVGLVVVLLVAVLVGFRPTATPVEWLAALGLLTLAALGITWLCVAIGLSARTVESASNLPMPLILLPFLGSGFVPTESMPPAMQWFADHQPFTPIIETLRGLLLGTAIGDQGLVAVVWCLVLCAVGYVWARVAYGRRPAR